MKLTNGGWWFPDGEEHLTAWMSDPDNLCIINGRQAYQGRKQNAAIQACRNKSRLRTAIDVGGHVGLWSYNLAHAFGTVHAFEPVEMMRECFVRNVEAKNVTLHDCALGAKGGSVAMHTTADSTGDSWVQGSGEIPMHALDTFELRNVDLIKVDCEGYEENVLRGAEQTIRRDMPVIIVEQKRDMASRFGLKPLGAVAFLKGLGYRVQQDIGGDFLMVPA